MDNSIGSFFPWDVTGPMFNSLQAMFVTQRLTAHEQSAWMPRAVLET